MYTFMSIFLIFMIYSIVGYITEIIFCSLNSKKIVWNRGFLIGPYLPIYGYGALIVIYTLSKYQNDLLALFIMSAVYCTVLEYLTSLVLEKVFHLRWWDYSEKKFNINGRVCLTNSVLFGLGGLIIIKIINPIISSFVFSLYPYITYVIGGILLFIYLFDTIVSVRIMFGIKTNIRIIVNKDATNQIKEEVNSFLRKHNKLTGRMLKSFPNLNNIEGFKLDKFIELLKKAREENHKKNHK